jgi:hypothetical protein
MSEIFYKLNPDGSIEPCSIDEWGRMFQDLHGRTIAKDRDECGDDSIEVSTVFLGMDHRFSGKGPPVLFETLVFGGPLDGLMERYCTRDEALAGHQAICLQVAAAKREAEPPDPA